MKFIDDLAAQAADTFKDTADNLWGSLGGSASQSRTVRNAKFSAGKYATLSTMVMMMNFPDNSALFRDAFNAGGNGPTGASGMGADKDVTANEIARTLANTASLSMGMSYQAIQNQGSADMGKTSTLKDINKLMPILTQSPEPQTKKKGGK